MKLKIREGILDFDEGTIVFPTTLAKVQRKLRELEEFGKSYGLASSVNGEGSAQFLTGRVKVSDLSTEDGIRKLNQLAHFADSIDGEKLGLLSGALAMERAEDLDDILRVINSLDQYEIFPEIKSDEAFGHFLVDTSPITGKFSFPEEAQPYLDYAKIGAEQRNALGGMYTPNGFIKRREETPAQEESPWTMLLTLTAGDQRDLLKLPASEDQLGRARRALEIEDFSQSAITKAEYVVTNLGQLIPMDCITVEDANEMAFWLQRLRADGEIMKYCAALEVEEPSTFTEALDIASDIDDYELISDSEREYGRQALRRMGANDEVLEAIEDHTDFDRLGSEMMEENGVRQTGFGLVRRLSKPFPPEPEVGQTMM